MFTYGGEKMRKRNKTKSLTYALILVTIITTSFAVIPNVQAAEVTTYAYISLRPNPVGIGQTALVVFWVMPLSPTHAYYGDKWEGFELTIGKPDRCNNE